MNTALKMEPVPHNTACSDSVVRAAKVTKEQFEAAVIAVGGKKGLKRSSKWNQMVEKSLSSSIVWPDAF